MNSQKKYSLFVWACFLLMPVLLWGCESSEVSMVKNAPFHLDNGITYGQLFDTYKNIGKGEWTVDTTDRGQKFVEFRAPYKISSAVQGLLSLSGFGNGQEYADEIAKSMQSQRKEVTLVVQFLISANGKSFSPGYAGIEYSDNSAKIESSPDIYQKALFKIVRDNETLMIPLVELFADIKFEFSKLFLQKNRSIIVDCAGRNKEWHFYFITIKDFSVDESLKTISMQATLNFTEADAKDYPSVEFPHWTDWELATFPVDLSSEVVDSCEVSLVFTPRKFDGNLHRIRYYLTDIYFSDEQFRYSVYIDSLYPAKVRVDIVNR